jgi:hypothetical protein
MRFIEMTGKTLFELIHEGEVEPGELEKAGVRDQSLVRVNLHGDIELRKPERWDVIGGLLGDFEKRVKRATGLDWA